MDPLSALAIAAAVLQFLELGGTLCVKGWEKYKEIQQAIPDDQELAEKEEELRKILEDLSSRISWFQQNSTSIVVSQPTTPAQVKLLKLSSQCASLSSDFEQIKSQMKLLSPQKMKSVKRKNRENAEVQIDKDIGRITEKLGPLKQDIMDFILLSLWDDSKRTKKWELHFNSQLDKLIELLTKPTKIPRNHVQQSGTAISIIEDEETTGLRNALQPLIQPGIKPDSLRPLAKYIDNYLQMDNRAMDAIRGDLVQILWENGWKLDPSMASPKINTTVVGRAITKGIQFSTIQTREDSIPNSFESTYAWIFEDESSNQDDMPAWNSFPRWLGDDSQKAYWITGKPGSGKSTIMKLILNQKYLKDRLSQSLGTLRLLLIKYYAWIAGDTLQKSIEGLKRTIIFQALEQYPDLAPILTPRRWAFCQVLRSTSGLPMWDTWEVEESFEALLSSCGEMVKLVLFIDGLDEFKTPPFEVIKCLRYMMTRCSHGLKACVASRPWPEFQDEFSDGPMLQMHLLTENDMKIFVNKNLMVNKGFVEQKQLNPDAASQLLMDIVQRANGVFLWVSIVVQLLFDRFSEGESIFQAWKALEALPSDISSLYDAIWAGIRSNNLPDASYLIQVLRAFEGPLPWLTSWLIEEPRFITIDKAVLPESEDQIMAAQRSLKRKLAARNFL